MGTFYSFGQHFSIAADVCHAKVRTELFSTTRAFLPDAMREALIYDLQVERFARGGSTITMQLVKNVFLNRNKNFARKLEEALIVWLIETERLTSKERMYEVYLNIAEWDRWFMVFRKPLPIISTNALRNSRPKKVFF